MYPRVARFNTPDKFQQHIDALGIELPFDATVEPGAAGPLGRPLEAGGRVVGNRFTILPMEGWDGTLDGRPTEHTERRWRRFGLSGAKWIWGGEAVAVTADGRANPNQLCLNRDTRDSIAGLRDTLIAAHAEAFGETSDLYVGLQLTHSGRFARPREKQRAEPRVLYHHPILEERFGITEDFHVLTDDEIRAIRDAFVVAARLAAECGFEFVDVKHCHGYLGHEFLSAFERPGPYGGSFENRTRFLREVIEGIRSEVPGLGIVVRVSAADWVPFGRREDGAGVPLLPESGRYDYAFGGDGTGLGFDLTEPKQLLDMFREMAIDQVCISVGSPYYNPHIQRPALFPPSDGYAPPEDPLVGVARQIRLTADLKAYAADLILVGSGYSYLQQWLPNVAQAVVRSGAVDSVGLGRMVLSYPDLPADTLAGRPLKHKYICRTFSDCTTAPRNGLISGCFPLDDYYKQLEAATQLKAFKRAAADDSSSSSSNS